MLEQPGSIAQVAQLVEQGTENPRARTADALLRFLALVDRSGGPEACHPFTGKARGKGGYGIFWLEPGKGTVASKLALEIRLGRDLLPGEVTRHGDACTTRLCCNGAHLSVGTQADNIADRDRLGRTQKGGRHYNAALNEAKVAVIKRRLLDGESRAALAREFGVGARCIGHIASGANWKHVQPGGAA